MNSNNKPLIYLTFYSFFIIISILAMPSTAVAKIYKWTDASGKTHYTANPPPAKAKAKTEEFKVRKIKKSSLTYKGDDTFQASNTQTNSQSKRTKKTKASPQSQCRNALRKVPKMASSLKRKLRQAKAKGKVSNEDYQKAMADLDQSRSNPQSMKECLQDYKTGGVKKNDVDLVANNSADDALSYMMLNAAFEQAAKDQMKKSKK